MTGPPLLVQEVGASKEGRDKGGGWLASNCKRDKSTEEPLPSYSPPNFVPTYPFSVYLWSLQSEHGGPTTQGVC